MADLVIGGNTYQGVEYLRIRRADGTVATFFDSDKKNNMQLVALLSHRKGLLHSMSVNVTPSNIAVGVASKKGKAHALSASVKPAVITAAAYRVIDD